MKQIKGIILFLMSIVLVAFGSQDSRSSKNLVKQLEDETKKVGDRIKDVKEEKAAKVETKKAEQKQTTQQPVQQKQTVVATTPAQPHPATQQPAAVPSTPAQSAQVTADPANPTFALNETDNENGKKENRRSRRNGKNGFKSPRHSRLKDNSSSAGHEKPSKSQDSAPKSSGSTSSGAGSSSGSSSSGGGDSSSSE